MDFNEEFFSEVNSGMDLDAIKVLRRDLARKYKLKELPNLIRLFSEADKDQREKIKHIKLKPTRTISGVSPVAVMAAPIPCPKQSQCTYCPGGPGSFFGSVPKSYTGNEPASMRAKRNEYDSYLQVFNRLEHYVLMNHDVTKCDVIVMGGTFTNFEKAYKINFVKDIFAAFNDFSELFFKNNKLDYGKFYDFFELNSNFQNEERVERVKEKIRKLKRDCNLVEEQKKNETVYIRCIGLTIETRPDCCNEEQCNEMLEFGVTRIELGIQSVYDEALINVKRGHLNKESIEAIKRLKNYGFKINAHYMLGLPGWNKDKDLEGLKKLFEDSNYKPDMLKIYPCLVMPGTQLHEEYSKGKFKPMELMDAAEVISEFKKYVPKYVRIMRVQRDISKNILGGVSKTNLRQYVKELQDKKNIICNCIRCREIRNEEIINPELKILEYNASGGKEFFISIEANDKLVGFCRLRFVD